MVTPYNPFAVTPDQARIRDWFKANLERKGKTKAALARHCDVTPQAVTKWVRQGKVDKQNLKKAAEYFGVPIESAYGLASLGESIIAYETAHDLPEGRYAMIPLLDVRVSAGSGVWTEDRANTKYSLAFLNGWINRKGYKPENLKLLEVRGDSMEPRIYDEDIVLIDVSDTTPKNGHVYALVYQDWVYLKRLNIRLDGTVEVSSDNPRYSPELVPPDDHERLRVIGRCVWAAGDGGL